MKTQQLIFLYKITTVTYGVLTVVSFLVKNPFGIVISGALFVLCFASLHHLEHREKIQEATA